MVADFEHGFAGTQRVGRLYAKLERRVEPVAEAGVFQGNLIDDFRVRFAGFALAGAPGYDFAGNGIAQTQARQGNPFKSVFTQGEAVRQRKRHFEVAEPYQISWFSELPDNCQPQCPCFVAIGNAKGV